jgi:hypothetical protein
MNHKARLIKVELVAADVGASTCLNPIGIWEAGVRSIVNLCLIACLVVGLACLRELMPRPTVVNLSADSTGVEIQKALCGLPKSGGEVVLGAGIFIVTQPIILQRDNQTLRGSVKRCFVVRPCLPLGMP